MATYEPVALPSCPAGGPEAADVDAAIKAWVRSDAMSALVRAFGGDPPTGPLGESLTYLEALSEAWDYRKGKLERRHVVPLVYERHIDGLIVDASAALGLAGHDRPAQDFYDHVLVLGGGPRTAAARPRYAAELLRGGITAAAVSVLSSNFEVSAEEQAIVTALGLPARATEAEMMAAGLEKALDLRAPVDQRDGVAGNGAPWRTWTYQVDGLTAHVLAAPPSDIARRANTADTYDGWAKYVYQPKPADRLLLVTTDLYLPYQHCDAVRMLGVAHRCGIETVGLTTDAYLDVLRPTPTSGLLLEVRSTILSMRRLREALR